MQSMYEMAHTLYQEPTIDDTCSSTLRPNQSGHHLLQHYYYSQFHQHPQKKQCHDYEHVYQLCQHPDQLEASQQAQSYHLGILSCRQPQEESTARVSFWKAFNTVLSDAKEKPQNFGELEVVHAHARDKEKSDQKGPDSALAVQNSHRVGDVGVNECHTRRDRRRRRKKKGEEEMRLMSAFFKRLVKRVINQQEVLQNKFLEVIERMDRERVEREEAWRRQETEIHDTEAIVKARERDLAYRRETSIVSSIEKITGQSLILGSRKTHH